MTLELKRESATKLLTQISELYEKNLMLLNQWFPNTSAGFHMKTTATAQLEIMAELTQTFQEQINNDSNNKEEKMFLTTENVNSLNFFINQFCVSQVTIFDFFFKSIDVKNAVKEEYQNFKIMKFLWKLRCHQIHLFIDGETGGEHYGHCMDYNEMLRYCNDNPEVVEIMIGKKKTTENEIIAILQNDTNYYEQGMPALLRRISYFLSTLSEHKNIQPIHEID